ncbi:MAG: MmgE/PrpD family protein [Deltaproteobacteria bacterium]|nr:MmgE/PrpD family protein [Deltaproteobacteria bacterium]
MSITLELVRNVLKTPFEAFDSGTLERARNRLIDVVGCALAGARAPGCSALIELLAEEGGRQESTVFVHGHRLPARSAALANSVMARSYDFEPTGPLVNGKSTPAHVSGTTVPAALAVGEHVAASGRAVLTALILGDDLASRIIAASNLNIDSGWDSTGTANAFGATAIAARLYGLDESQALNALGLVLNRLAGTFQNIHDGAHSFKLPQGLAAEAGIFSAALARKGFTGVRDALLSKNGYFSLYCRSYQLDALTHGLGGNFCADNTHKPYPCCRSNHSAIDCVLDLLQTHPIDPEEVEQIVVDVTPTAKDFAVGRTFRLRDVPQIDAAFSLQYTVASTLFRKSVRLEHFTEEYVRDPAVLALAEKIRLRDSIPPEKPLGARVRIELKHGAELEKCIDMPRGNGTATPLSAEEKRKKFLENARFSEALTATQAEELLYRLERFEELECVSVVGQLLS